MLKILQTSFVAAALLALPAMVNAYGAAHVGYTHVGPNGVQHYGETVARGPSGTYGSTHASAYGAGGAYHTESRAGVTNTGAYGASSSSGYHYAPSYGGAAYGQSRSYSYVR